jgi:hypothetical protein
MLASMKLAGRQLLQAASEVLSMAKNGLKQ